MAARKTAPKKCLDCTGAGETAETVRVGSRKLRDTDHRQAGLGIKLIRPPWWLVAVILLGGYLLADSLLAPLIDSTIAK
ncbi:hypothetical protein [Streptomyces lavendulocolor]|uniref:hypothetical protein n=1 Tax=Streptomyces lavendulocolor TaxID=67316 RepID=UPI0031D0B56B